MCFILKSATERQEMKSYTRMMIFGHHLLMENGILLIKTGVRMANNRFECGGLPFRCAPGQAVTKAERYMP